MRIRSIAVAVLGPVAVACVVTSATLVGPVAGAAERPAIADQPVATSDDAYVVERGRPDVRVPFAVKADGEAVLDLRSSAPGTDWAVKGKESAVMSVFLDARYATDVVVTGTAAVDQQVALGRVQRGHHWIRLHFAAERSAATARKVLVSTVAPTTYAPGDPSYTALRYAPVVYGRNLPELGGPNQNATTDTPLIAWHEATSSSVPGGTRLTYSVVWSNEDGGTNTPALMARWGRTTDIEWIYAVDVDANGERVQGSDVYQAPNHQTLTFHGTYDGDHAELQTCTSNNNMCDVVDNPMRFFPSALQTRPDGRAREYLMDVNPWTYLVMAKEMIREGKIEAPSDTTAATPEVSDQRNYLYAVVKKTTEGANSGSSWVGVSLGVRLTSGDTVYLSHHVDPTWSLQRDDPAATTVELPAGTTTDDIAEITVHRVVVGTDTGVPVRVTAIDRAFLLDQAYLPQESFLSWTGDVRLTSDQPTAVLWSR